MILIQFFISILLSSHGVGAQEILDLTYEIKSEKKNSISQKEVFDQAIEKASQTYIESMIGSAKASKNQNLIKSKIVKNSGKYVLFIKLGSTAQRGEESIYNVQLKVSLKNLESLLLQEGLLYKSDGPPKIISLINFTDKVNSQSFSWWTYGNIKELTILYDLSDRLHDNLRKELRGKGFFVMEPRRGRLNQILPAPLRTESLATDDLMLMADFFKAQSILKGQVGVTTHPDRKDVYRIEVRLTALHANNGRVIGEVVRNYETEYGKFHNVVLAKVEEVFEKLGEDLSSQVHEAWKSGTFGATLLNVAVNGSLSYQELAQFKKLMLEQVRELKTLKERLFAPNRVVFETDTGSNSEQLAGLFKEKSFGSFRVSVSEVRRDGVELRVSTK